MCDTSHGSLSPLIFDLISLSPQKALGDRALFAFAHTSQEIFAEVLQYAGRSVIILPNPIEQSSGQGEIPDRRYSPRTSHEAESV